MNQIILVKFENIWLNSSFLASHKTTIGQNNRLQISLPFSVKNDKKNLREKRTGGATHEKLHVSDWISATPVSQ